MVTTTQYLEQLQADKQTLVDNLVAKGMEASNDETFTSLVPKVADIQSGGGDIYEYFNETVKYGTNVSGGWMNVVKKLPPLTNEGANCNYLFANFKGTEINLSKLNWDIITQVRGMFYHCSNLTTLDLSNCFTQPLTNVQDMFYGCTNLTHLDLRGLTIGGEVIGIAQMFRACSKLEYLDIRDIDFGTLTGSAVFYGLPNDCEIIVKDDTVREQVLTFNSKLTNIKTVAELES